MLQQDEPDDYVIATGEQHAVREFAERAFAEVGIRLRFEGEGAAEVGVVADIDDEVLAQARQDYGRNGGPVIGSAVIKVDARYYRPTEVASLIGDATKARERLGWTATIRFEQLVAEMVAADLAEARQDDLLLTSGFAVKHFRE